MSSPIDLIGSAAERVWKDDRFGDTELALRRDLTGRQIIVSLHDGDGTIPPLYFDPGTAREIAAYLYALAHSMDGEGYPGMPAPLFEESQP